MNAKKRKSKRQSAANSKPPPKDPVFYLDRNLGKHVIADALRNAGISVEVHDDHLPANAPDEDWIALVAEKGWVALTKDKNIRYRYSEIESIKEHKARVLVIRAKNTTGEDIANLLLDSINRIRRFLNKTDAPFVAGIDRSGKVSSYDI